ncbi:T9SS type A sorting domain-containing protein [Dyadobacter sp. LJ419]|uniref:T9SS type A sorting domain-containing protein n=1 Tax=Dyadobacter chenwenxiniae TaxID=2906456 RepID=A0A9X1PNV0_9BACT|nr:CBM35 domain-containing protein [Dyadobacter chenwenxiniae]MCF0064605.1 T9SS type A sorting domain-containing protein [Dyadobacter chenwenxiniae]
MLVLVSFPSFSQSFEAESGTLANGADIQNCDACSSQKMVGNLGGGSVTIPVNVATAGNYRLTLSYATGDQRTINVTPNGGDFIAVTCPASGGWSAVASIGVNVPLQAGNNSIKLDNAFGYGPNVDKIVLTPLNTASIQTIAFGTNSRIDYDLSNGTYDVYFDNVKTIGEAFATANSDAMVNSTAGYTSRTYSSAPANDSFGSGTRHVITLTGGGQLEMQQVFYTYTGKNHFYTELILNGSGSNSYKMTPLTSNAVDIHSNGDRRGLFVPFDNDKWVRYEAKEIGYANFTSSEAGAIYDNTSRKGLIIGSVEHEVWKTGVNLAGEGRTETSFISVIAGWTNENVTRDKRGHGWVGVGQQSCKSPRIMVGYYGDWRDGFEQYGKANALAEPRYIFDWTAATPFGWNSWGAIQSNLNLPKAKSVVDYFATQVPAFRNGDNTLFVDLDSYWDNLAPGGMTGDFSQLTEFANYCKSKGLKPGIYWAPFVDWGKSARQMEGSAYNYEDVWTKVNGGPLDLDGAYALDPTHPGTKARIAYLIGKFKACGFEMIKIDFLAHASLEADSFYESGVHTGMEAYKAGMEYLTDQLDGTMLVYAAISPNLATGRYAHMRRIACDAYKHISETAYTLNSTNYGWWQNQIYQYIDADHIVFGTETAGENRARLASSIVTGTIITGDDYATDGAWKAVSQTLLQNADLLNLAKDGKAFRPVEGNTGWDPNALFVKTIGVNHYLAVFNYGTEAKAFSIDLARAGLSGQVDYATEELFSGNDPSAKKAAVLAQGTLSVNVPAQDAMIIQLRDSALPVTLANFQAERAGYSALLTWETASETNNKEFVIERSLDARTFKVIGKVPGHGDTSKAQHYAFNDQVPNADSINYYRLKQVDFDGKYEHSRIVAVKFAHEDSVTLFPNPGSTQLNLKVPQNFTGELQVTVMSTDGKQILAKKFSKYTEKGLTISIGQLDKGIYLISVADSKGNNQRGKFVKN